MGLRASTSAVVGGVDRKFLAWRDRCPDPNDPGLRLPEKITHQGAQTLQYWLGEEKKCQEQTRTLFRRLRDEWQYQVVLMEQIEHGDLVAEESILRKWIPDLTLEPLQAFVYGRAGGIPVWCATTDGP